MDAAGTLTTQRVDLGVQGADRVQVTSDLRAGQFVVLADVGAAVPSSGTTLRGGGFGGGLGGARDGFGGAFGGARPGLGGGLGGGAARPGG